MVGYNRAGFGLVVWNERPAVDWQQVAKTVAIAGLALLLAILGLSVVPRVTPSTMARLASLPGVSSPTTAQSSTVRGQIPAGLQRAIHARFGPGPIGLGSAPLVSGIAAAHAGGWIVRAPGQRLTAHIGTDGAATVRVASNNAVAAHLGLQALSLGAAATPLRVRSTSLSANDELKAEMGPAQTWYRLTGTGLEQGFTILRAPAGSGQTLTLDLGSAAGWKVAAGGTALRAVQAGSRGASLSFGGLRTTDATGAPVAGSFRIAHGDAEIALTLGGHTTFPLTVDPTWVSTSTRTATLSEPSTGSGQNLFGIAVALSDDATTAVIGAQGVNTGRGAVYVFHESSAGAWTDSPTPTATLTNSASAANDFFGHSVAISGDGTTVVVGAYRASSTDGAAYVYHVPDETSWVTTSTPVVTLSDPAAVAVDRFGQAVALSDDGTTALIGAQGTGSSTGAAYVFRVADENSWAGAGAPSAALTDASASSGADFGISVSLSADNTTAVVGSTGLGTHGGVIDVFHVASQSAWATTSTPTATLSNAAGVSADTLGNSVAISADGTVVTAGAPGHASNTGEVAVFQGASEAAWSSTTTPTALLTASNGATGDHFGFDVSISGDGTTILAGAYGAAGSTGLAGVFHASSESGWAAATQTATLTAHATLNGCQFGQAVALSHDGTTGLIGAPLAYAAGTAYMFHAGAETSWASTENPNAQLSNGLTPQAFAQFGKSLALSGDGTVAVIGAPGASSYKGAVFVYTSSNESAWTPEEIPTAILTNGSGVAGDEFGSSVAVSQDGTTVLIGAHRANASAGAAYVYHVSSETSWASTTTPKATLTRAGGSPGDGLGVSSALSSDGTVALIGANGVASATGAAYIYDASSESTWGSASSPVAALSDASATAGAEDGWSVSLAADGKTAAVSLVDSGSTEGAVDVYRVSSETAWASTSSPTATLTNSSGSSGDKLGTSVSISGDGTTIVAGAQGVSTNTGAAYVFHVASAASWATSSSPTATLSASGGATNSFFGSSVALSSDGTLVVIGALGTSSATGSAYAFRAADESSWAAATQSGTLTDASAQSGDQLGSAVALSQDGTTTLVGADLTAQTAAPQAGQSYVFHATSEASWSTTSSPVAFLQPPDDNKMGFAVALSSDSTTAVVADPVYGFETGAAFVFHVGSAGAWAPSPTPIASAMLTDPGAGSFSGFGDEAAISPDGTTVFIGAPGTLAIPGVVDVYHVPSESVWATTSQPVATLSAAQFQFGVSMAVSSDGTVAVVGSRGTHAYVFTAPSESAWTSTSSPTTTLGEGSSVAISADGTTALVGKTVLGGSVSVYRAASEAGWSSVSSPAATLTNGTGGSSEFGSAVALSADGTTALIGDEDFHTSTGSAYLFHVNVETAWATTSVPTATLSNAAGASDDVFGNAVSLSSDGATALIGAEGAHRAYVFQAANESSWTTSSAPLATISDPFVGFGFSVAFSGDATTALIGSPSGTYGAVFRSSFAVPTTPTISNVPASNAVGGGFSANVATNSDGTPSVTSSTPGVCTVSGSPALHVSYGALGTCTLTPHVAASTNFVAADGTPVNVPVRKTPTVSISNLPASGTAGGGFTAAVATNSDGSTSVTSNSPGVCNVAGTTVSYLAAGTCSLTAHVAASATFNPADGPAQNVTVNHAPDGYWLVGSDGGIFSFGAAVFHGSTGNLVLNRPVVGISPTADRNGYWLVATDGGIFAFDAPFEGSLPGLGITPYGSGLPHSLNAPIVGMVPANGGQGYFLVGSDGGVFAFNAPFAGSCPGIGGCAGAAVAVMDDATGGGYWVVTSTGNVYGFGDAGYFGAPGPQSSSITSAVATPDGRGYWIVDGAGQVFNYGDAPALGSLPAGATNGLDPASTIFADSDGGGYWVSTAVGRVYQFGDAPFDGDMSGTRLNGPIVAATGF